MAGRRRLDLKISASELQYSSEPVELHDTESEDGEDGRENEGTSLVERHCNKKRSLEILHRTRLRFDF